MSITDRLKFITRSYLNSLRKRSRSVLSESGLGDLDITLLDDDELEQEIRRKVTREFEKKTPGRKSRKKAGTKSTRQRRRSSPRRRIAQCYANLELSPGAPVDDIHKAWRRLLLKYHPDRYPGDKAKQARATRITQIINESYTTLLEHLDVEKP